MYLLTKRLYVVSMYVNLYVRRWGELASLVSTKKQQLDTAFGIQDYSEDVKETMVCSVCVCVCVRACMHACMRACNTHVHEHIRMH